jgi:hypothetical protein
MSNDENRFDRLADALCEAEAVFRNTGFTATAFVELACHAFFGYGKAAGAWSLYILRNEVEGRIPLNAANLNERCEAAHALPALFEALRAAQRDQTKAVETAAQKAEDFADDILKWLANGGLL